MTTTHQPETAKGEISISPEDRGRQDPGHRLPGHLGEAASAALVRLSRLMAVMGRWQREAGVCNIVAGHLYDLTPMLAGSGMRSRDFR